jgi:small conductance mechanosensitive channel
MSDFLEGIFTRFATIFEPQALGESVAGLLANGVLGIATFGVYYVLWRILDRVAVAITRRTGVDRTAEDFTRTILQFAVLALGVVSALGAVGVNTASLLTSLGIAGLTIGFAARDALSNIISGILIFWDRPFVIGDLVEVGGEYGRVERITLRSTRIVTPDGRMLAVPNTEIINRTVASYTNFPHLRLDITVTVGVKEDLDRVRRLLLSLVEEDSRFMTDPAPVAVVKQLNDYNVQLELRTWIHDERRHIELRCALREEMFRALTQAGVDMPFETFRVEPLTVRSSAA